MYNPVAFFVSVFVYFLCLIFIITSEAAMSELFRGFSIPKIGKRIYKTLLSAFIVAFIYDVILGGRNPCFALIGCVYGMGSTQNEGIRCGIGRSVGTLLGGLIVIPFYWLYHNTPLGIPDYVYLILGLFLVIYINCMCGTNAAIQPAVVVYCVVLFTVSEDRYVSYTIARIIDTFVGAAFSLVLAKVLPSPKDKEQKQITADSGTDTK